MSPGKIAASINGLLILLLTAGCAGPAPAHAGEPPEAAATQASRVAPEPLAPSDAPAPEPPMPGTTENRTIANEPMAPATAPPSASRSASKPASVAAEVPAKAPAPAASAREAARQQASAPGPVKPVAPPTLDLKSLETRLKETKAIGVFTKLAIKNQVDDLLDRFRAYYDGQLKTTLGELRRPYDGLVLKIVALLQDADPSLAGDVVASREAIWGILADRVKFANR